MNKPNYVKDDMPIEFDVMENRRPINPLSATIQFYSPDLQLLLTDRATVNKNHVYFLVRGRLLKKPGEYEAVFRVNLPYHGHKTHKITKTVSRMPLPLKILRRIKR